MEITIKSIFGGRLFKYYSENNTILKTLIAAIDSGADLRNADIIGANLSGANLRNADIIGANLSGANLNGANLSGADIIGANLRDANLRDANLNGANLNGANLSGANLNGANLNGANLNGANLSGAKIPIYSKWLFSIKNDTLNIGCKSKSFEEWESWFMGTEEYSTARDSEDFKRLHAMFLAYKAYYEFMKS